MIKKLLLKIFKIFWRYFMKSYKQTFFLILLTIWILLPTIAFAQTKDLPDFFIRIPTQPYNNSVYNEFIFTEMSDTEITYYISGQLQTTNLPILIKNDQTMLPLRLVGEACGADVVWDKCEQQATITLNKHKAIIKPSSNVILVNDVQLNINTAALMHNDTLYLPLRSIGEALGKKIIWQNKLEQSFIIVCNQEQNFSNRNQFNTLLSKTYLKDMLETEQRQLLDVGQNAIISVDKNGNYYRNYVAINESTAWHDFDDIFPDETAAMAEKLECTFRYYDPPMPNAETLAAFYADGDVKIIYDVPPYHSFDAFIYDNYVYIKEYHNDTEKFLRINLETAHNEYFVPEIIKESDFPDKTK